MTQRELEAVIGRAVIDEEFRLLLFADPNAALAGYELTEKEVVALKKLDVESVDACADIVAQRRVRSS
jgi:hypothetical protein